MPEISRDDVAHLAGLARIQLDEDELDRLVASCPRSWSRSRPCRRRSRAATTSTPMSHPTPLTNVFREDVGPAQPDPRGRPRRRPGQRGQRFLVPKILGEE